MPVTSSTIGGVNTWTFSGAVTDAQIQTAWSALVTNGVYIINRAIYLDNTADLSGVTGGFLVDFGTQVNPAIILHTSRDKTKTVFNNFTFLQRTGLSVGDRTKFVQNWNGTALVALGGGSNDGLQQKGGGFVYGVVGNPGGADPRYLNEIGLSSLENTTYFSQEFTEQELQPCVGVSTILKNLTFEKCFGFPQIQTLFGNSNVVVYRSTQNTQHATQLPIRVYPSSLRWASVCYVDSYVTRNNADVTTRLIDMFGSNANQPADVMILNNYTRESWFGASKTTLPVSNWAGGNQIIGGVLKKLQFVNGGGGVVRAYDSRSTTTAQKTVFAETGFRDFLNTNLAPTTDANGKITMVHVGAICTTNSVVVTRYTGQKYTFQKFGYRVMVGTPDMTSGDNDLSAFAPITITSQDGIVRTQSAITAATSITTFQDLLEELHVLAIGLTGAASYSGAYDGNLFNFSGGVLTTRFSSVTINPSATSKISYNSTTNALIIKSSTLLSTEDVARWNNTTGAINLLGGASIKGIYQSNTGASASWTFKEVQVGTSLVVYDAANATKYFQEKVTTAGDYTLYIPPGVFATYKFGVRKPFTKPEYGTFNANAGMALEYFPSYTEDVGYIATSLATITAYTKLENDDAFFDYYNGVAALTEAFIKLGDIVQRDGTKVSISAPYSLRIKKTNAAVISAPVSNVIYFKGDTFDDGDKYKVMKLVSPATFIADTNEPIIAEIEDGNGDSSFNVQGGSGSYSLYRYNITTTAFPSGGVDERISPANLIGNIGSGKYRFLASPNFNYMVQDNTQGNKGNVPKENATAMTFNPMVAGAYDVGLFQGEDQIDLAQVNEVYEILDDVKVLLSQLSDVKDKTDNLTFTQSGAVDANIQYVNDVEVKGVGTETDPWNPV